MNNKYINKSNKQKALGPDWIIRYKSLQGYLCQSLKKDNQNINFHSCCIFDPLSLWLSIQHDHEQRNHDTLLNKAITKKNQQKQFGTLPRNKCVCYVMQNGQNSFKNRFGGNGINHIIWKRAATYLIGF